MAGPAFQDSDIERWLASEPQWTTRLGKGWKGTKFLGKGSFGIAGLWEYRGDESSPEAPDAMDLTPSQELNRSPALFNDLTLAMRSSAPAIKKVVVKQSEAEDTNWDYQWPLVQKTPLDEVHFLAKLSLLGSKHIVRQFGENKLGDRFGDMGKVVRIFLEYCPGGDLNQFVGPPDNPTTLRLLEVDIWAIFHCIALGLTVMDRGTEDIKAPAWRGEIKTTELAHYDIKPDNIFLGYRDSEHPRVPIAKIADFGEAVEVKRPADQDNDYGGIFGDRGFPMFQTPEDTIYHRFAGAVMNCLLLGRYIDFNSEDPKTYVRPKTSQLKSKNPSLSRVVNHSVGLDAQEVTDRFSESLRALIQECLLRESLSRPKSTELVSRTRKGLTTALRVVKVLDPSSSPLNDVPFTSLERDEPPMSWEIPEFVVVETDREVIEAVDNTIDGDTSGTGDWNVIDAVTDIL